MNAHERASLARVRRAAIVAQRAIEVLGGTQEAHIWLSTRSPALDGKAPKDIHYDAEGARRVLEVLRGGLRPVDRRG